MASKFDHLDLDNGFVLSQDEAIEYLKWNLNERFDMAIADPKTWGEDSETFGEEARDIVEMATAIGDGGYAWVKFEHHPMSVSGIVIREMKEA